MKKHHWSKGQAISLDWLTGISLFMVAVVASTFVVVTDHSNTQTDLRSQAEDVSQQLKDETQMTARKIPLYVRGPHKVGKIPVDTTYNFSVGAESGIMDVPSNISESDGSIITLVEAGNNSYEMTYFFEELDEIDYVNDIEYDGNRVENTNISFVPSNTGLDSLRINGKEFLNTDAEFEDATTNVEEKELHAEVDKLKIYNESRELILENPDATFNLRNFTDLYWGEDGNLYDLEGTGNIVVGGTPGLTVATYEGNDYGLTFVGDIWANVSKPDRDTVKVDVNGSQARIMLHDTDYSKGQERIEFYEDGDIYFGAERQVSGIHPSKTTSLKNMIDIGFENRFDLRDYNYNITLLDVERGAAIPFQNVVAHTREASVIGRYGNFSSTSIKVRLWQ